MKKICIVSGVQLWPPESGGQLRTATLAEALGERGHRVSVYSLTGRKAEYKQRQPSALYERALRVTEYVDRSWTNAFWQLLTYRLSLPDFWHVMGWGVPSELRRCLKECDVAIADFPFLARYLRHTHATLRVINSHNLEFERWQTQGWRRVLSPMVRRIESRAAKNADMLFVTSDHEAAFYRARGAPSALVPNAIAAGRFTAPTGTREATRQELLIDDSETVILFAASRYEPNRMALDYLKRFNEANAEFLRARHLVFLVVGSVARQFSRRGALVMTGPVPTTERYFAAADWAINPVTVGSGTNLKMAEYLMARLPILSTPFGKRGLLLSDDDYLTFQPADLRLALEQLAAVSPDGRKEMARGAYEKNRSAIDMEAVVEQVIQPLLDGSPPELSP